MKGYKIKAVVYVLIFIATAVVTYIHKNGTLEGEKDANTMDAAGLPVVHMESEAGISYNYLHGYTSEVDTALIRDCITPVSSDNSLVIYIDNYNAAVSGVEYEIRSIDQSELIDRNTADNYQYDVDGYKVELGFTGLLVKDTEYMLKITVSTEEHDSVDYYTRIIVMDNANLDKKLAYVTLFSECALDDNRLNEIAGKMETNSTGDNTNLGRVNIHSRLSQVGFADLNPVISSDRYFSINEIDTARASITINYEAQTGNEDEGTIDYKVKEFLRIYQPDDTVTYVYNYDRFMDQIFDENNAVTDDGEIYIGISSDEEINMKSSADGDVTIFERNGNLWKYHASKNTITSIFTFEDDTSDSIREEYMEHGYKILDVSDEGDVRFLVYGYMNRGPHEGKLGISVCSYSAENNITEEILFIPRTITYESMESDINTLSYINDSGVLYIYYNNTVYYYNINTKESMITVSDIDEGSYCFSEENKLFAYQNGNDINLIKLETGEIYIISAEEGSVLKSIGFIDENYIYGTALKSMISTNETGNETVPMYKISIMANDYSIIREYAIDGVYISSAAVTDNQLVLKRVSINEDGTYSSLSDDRILSAQNNTSADLEIISSTSDIRKKEIYISLLDSGSTVTNSHKSGYRFFDDTIVYAGENNVVTHNMYYVYVYGGLYRICDTASAAVLEAYNTGGVVTDNAGNTIWTRYRDTSARIDVSDNAVQASDNSRLAATDILIQEIGVDTSSEELYNKGYGMVDCIEELAGRVVDLTGCSAVQMTYFISEGKAVIAMTENSQFELVYGYDSNNIYTISFTEGTRKTYTIDDFETLTGSYGSVFISY